MINFRNELLRGIFDVCSKFNNQVVNVAVNKDNEVLNELIEICKKVMSD